MQGQQDGKYFIAGIYYIVGNAAGQGIVLLSSGIFTRLMGQQTYGLVSTYSAWVLVLNTFIGLNLFITVRNAYIDYHEDYERYVSSVLLLSLTASGIITVGLAGGMKLLYKHADLFAVLLAAVQAVSLHTINYVMAVLSMKNKYKLRTLLLILPNCIHTVLSIMLILEYPEKQYYAKIIGNSAGLFIFAFISIVCIFKKAKPCYIRQYWEYALRLSLPAILNTLSDLVLMQSDRIMLNEMAGPDETAVYSLVYNVGSILIALYTALNGAWVPWFYKHLAIDDAGSIKKVQTIYLYGFTLLTIGILTVSPEIIKILSPQSYWKGIRYVNLIVAASFLIFIYVFFTAYLMYLKKNGIIARNTVIAAAINILFNGLFIPHYQAAGAAAATIFSYAVLFTLHYRAVKEQGMKYFCVLKMFGCIGVVIVYGAIFYSIRDLFWIRYFIFTALSVFAVIVVRRLWDGHIKN